MADKNYQDIVNGIDSLANGNSLKTNGKVTGVNVAAVAGVSKATLYRYFKDHVELRETYDALRKNGIRLSDDAPETIEQAFLQQKEEIKLLRSELAEYKNNAAKTDKLKSHQIQILWMDNERLQAEIKRLQDKIESKANVAVLPSRKEGIEESSEVDL